MLMNNKNIHVMVLASSTGSIPGSNFSFPGGTRGNNLAIKQNVEYRNYDYMYKSLISLSTVWKKAFGFFLQFCTFLCNDL